MDRFKDQIKILILAPLALLTLAATMTGAAPVAAQTEPQVSPAPIATRIKVMAKGSGIPLSRVEIRIGEAKTYTDPKGEAAVAVPNAGDTVTLYRAGYDALTLTGADLKAGAEPVPVYLFPATPADNEVLVIGQRRPETSRKTVSIEEAVKVAPGGDPAQIPKLLPGVQTQGFRPDIIVRGSGPFDSKYFIEEWPVPFMFHRIGNLSIMPEQLLSDVEFSSGGFGAQDGNATGGIVTLRTKSEVPEHPKTEVKINVPVLSGIYHERPVGGTEAPALFAASARRSYIDFFLKRVLPEDAGLTLVPYFGDVHFYYHRPTDDGHVKVLGLYAYDGLKLLFSGGPAEDEDGRGRFSLQDRVCLTSVQWRKNLNANWSMSVSPRVTDVKSHADIVGNRIHINATGAGSEAELTRRLGGRDKLYVGVLGEYIYGRADVLAPKPDFSDPFFDFEEAPKVETRVSDRYVNAATWVSLDQEFGPLFLTPGVRVFHATQIDRTAADPRLNARLKVTDIHAVKGAVGQYSQTPEFRDTSKDFGNPHLDFLRSYHYVLGLETTWSDRWTTDFQGFYKETKNLVRGDPDTNTNGDGSLISHGLEAFVRRNLTQRFFGWLSYTWSRTRERDSDDETYRNSQYDQTHVANLVGNYKLTGIWELGGRLIYHTGDTYTGVDDAVYNTNLDKYQPRRDPTSRLYNERLPDYHELDIYAGRDFLWDTWKLAARFGVEFLALERQAMGVQNNYDYSDEEYFRGIPPIPYIEVRGVL